MSQINKRARCVLLFSGPMAVGKTKVADALINHHFFHRIRSSNYLRDLGERQGIEITRTSLQDLGDSLDTQTDYKWVLDQVAIPLITASPEKNRWLFDSVRKPQQIKHFRDYYTDDVHHIHFIAPEYLLEKRYNERLDSGNESGFIPYLLAKQHANEISSRSLGAFADTEINTENSSADEIAKQIIKIIGLGY